MIAELRPSAHASYLSLPVLGSTVESFTVWCNDQGYARRTMKYQLTELKHLDRYLRRRRVRSLGELRTDHLDGALRRFRGERSDIRQAILRLRRFLVEGDILAVVEPPKTRSAELLDRFAVYLRGVRGLAENTILAHTRRIRLFLVFLRFDRQSVKLGDVRIDRIEAFLRHAAQTNNRFSLQQIVSTLRGFFRWQHSEGTIREPLHLQIDTPLVYRLEALPVAWTWEQVRALLASVDRSTALGLRDFTILYLMAAYGLRSCEVVRLRLDDIGWRHATLRIVQTKTRQTLFLPLTDEAGDILQQYLRRGRGTTVRRELFFRVYAPRGPLKAGAVCDMLRRRICLSGLELPFRGTPTLRHSFAVRLLRQGVPMKTIGDTLGHRRADSTLVYLRLAVDDLRCVGLPVPDETSAVELLPPGWRNDIPRVRPHVNYRTHPIVPLRSHWAGFVREYLATRRALGRQCVEDERILRNWDAFMFRFYPDATVLTGEMFCEWVNASAHLGRTAYRSEMQALRRFLLFHSRHHGEGFIPAVDTFPLPSPRRPPRIVSEKEIACALATTANLPSSSQNPLRAESMRIGLVLLYCCGLRRGELLSLRLIHVDWAQRLLRVEATKFNKTRLVPMSDSVSQMVQDYVDLRRRRKLPSRDDSFLICSCGRRLSAAGYSPAAFRSTWQHLCLSVGMTDEHGLPPTLQDLRHSFAVAALHRWYMQGEDAQARLPYLAAYMGHVNPVSTYYYLHLTPQLRDAASDRFHALCAPLFNQGGQQ